MAGDDQPARGELADRLRLFDPLRSRDRLGLCREDVGAADAGEAEQAEQCLFVIGCALGGGLCFGDVAVFEQDEVRVGVGVRILIIVEIEDGGALVDAARNRRDLLAQRIGWSACPIRATR